MKGNVWLIGGTSDSVAIAKALASSKIRFVVTVASQTASFLYTSDCRVISGCMHAKEMQCFCREQNVIAVVDASHPYAVEVSHQAIATSAKLNIPYLRYERSDSSSVITTSKSPVIELNSFETLLRGNYLAKQRVLLTVGCKALPLFKPWQDRATLFARVLPKITSLQIALDAGFTSDRLITLRPPIGVALEKALWQQWKISTVVTKASGKAGGEDTKRQVAADLGISLITITRPLVNYPRQTSAISDAIEFCQVNTADRY